MSDEIFEIFGELFERRRKNKRYGNGDHDGYQQPASNPPPPPAPVVVPIFCIECGARNEGNSKFCLSCGELLPAAGEEMRCPRCSTALPLAAKFCPRCGAGVG